MGRVSGKKHAELEAFWRFHHEARAFGGLNQRDYCQLRGLPLKRFGNWWAPFKLEEKKRPVEFLYRRGGLRHMASYMSDKDIGSTSPGYIPSQRAGRTGVVISAWPIRGGPWRRPICPVPHCRRLHAVTTTQSSSSYAADGRCRFEPRFQGIAALIALGKPLRPSTTAISISATPRFLSSFMTRSQNLAPSVARSNAEDVLRSVGQDAERDVHRLVAHDALVADFDSDRVEEYARVIGVQRSPLPFGDCLQHGVGNRRDQVRRTSIPYSSSRCPQISRTIIPRACIDTILSSKSGNRRWYLAISLGSNVLARSRGTSSVIFDVPVSTV